MEKEKNKENKIKKVISIILTVIVILTIAGISLAYFLANVEGNGKSITSQSGNLSINYNDEKEIIADNLIPGWTDEKEITVTNNGEQTTFNLYWSCVENELTRTGDLTYKITDEEGNEIKNTIFPTETEEKTIISQTINKGETKTYTIKIEYARSNEDQSVDMGKIFKGIINIQGEGREQINECPSETYTVRIEPSTWVEEGIKEVKTNEDVTFTYTGTIRNPKINCTNNQSGKIEGNIITINKVTNDTTCTITNTNTVEVNVINGKVNEREKEVETNEDAIFTITNNNGYSNPEVTCTNNQKGTIENNTLTIERVTNDTICTVEYKAEAYTITYNLDGGSATNPNSYTIESDTITLNNPSKTGYTFTGWTGSNGSTAQTTVTIPKGSTGNKSYTANYRANTYQVKYNANGGSGTMSNSTHTYGVSKALSTNTFTREGYTFQGWSTSSSSSTVSYTNGQSVSNLTSEDGEVVNLYAVWKINTYTVSVVVQNGTVSGSTSKSINYNSSGTFTVNASTGYSTPTVSCTNSQKGSISGTTLTVSNVTNNTTCTVTYKPITYTIAYNLDGGITSGNPNSYTIESNTITLNNPSKTGYTFTGWTGSNGSTAQTTVTIPKGSTGNKSYTANYKINTYTVKATVLNGTISGSTSKSVNYNSSITFTVNPSSGYGSPIVQCTNSQTGTMNGNTLTVSNVTNNTTCTVTYIKTEYEFDYTGGSQTFTAPVTGTYQIELWGASSISLYDFSGKGAYTSGKISLNKNEKVYLYVGGEGLNANETAMGGYNGGGNTSKNTNGASGYTGAGATDIRLISGAWNNTTSLRSRIMVAGGGAFSMKGDVYANLSFGHAGGLVGEDGNYYFNSDGTSNLPYVGEGGTQTAGGAAPTKHPVAVTNGTAGSFGIGGTGGQSSNGASVGGGAGGGGGYYGGSGASGLYNGTFSGGGGSSYISGHIGCVAITSEASSTPKTGCTTGTTNNSCSVHYSGKVFTNTIMIDGAGYKWTNTKGSLTLMPNPNGGNYSSGYGHTGNGYAKISLIST